MSRLPKVGGDDQIWGDLLNDYLNVEHNIDGTHNTSALLNTPQNDGLMLVSKQGKARGIDWVAVPTAPPDPTASNGLVAAGRDIQIGGSLTTNSAISLAGSTLGFKNSTTDKTEIDATGFVRVTRSSGNQSFIEGWRANELNPRFYVDAFGSMHLGGTGLGTPQHIIAKDSGNGAWLNYTNQTGPASIIIVDSNASSGNDAESTLTIRVKVPGGSEFIDRYANHYTSKGDIGYGELIQKTGAGAYREYLFGYYDAADTDPANQIQNAERFYRIIPQAAAGTSGTRVRGQIYFRPPDGSVNPSAHIHIGKAIGGGTTGSAPVKIDSGPLLTTPEDGAIEYDGTHFYATTGSGRSQIDLQTDGTAVHTTGAESISGVKTFNTAPVITPAAAPAAPVNGQIWSDSAQLSLASKQGGLKLFHAAAIFMATATVNNQNTTTETSLIGTGVGTTLLPANFLVPGKTIRLHLAGILITGGAPPTSTLKIKLGNTSICTTGTFTLPASMGSREFFIDATLTCRSSGAAGAILGEGQLQFMTAANGTPTAYEMANTGTISVDTTAALSVDATHTWGAGASPSYTVSCKIVTVEVLG